MNRYILLTMLLIISFRGLSQGIEIPKTNKVSVLSKYDSIFVTLNDYLIENVGIEKDNNTIFLFNLLTWNTNEFIQDKPCIYIFGIKFSDPIYYVFFYNHDRTYSINNGQSVVLLLNELTVFFIKNDINAEDQLFYSFGILKHLNTINGYPIKENLFPRNWHK